MPVYACLRGGSPSAAEGVNGIILLDALGSGWLCVETNLAEVPQVLEMLRAQPLAQKPNSSAEGADLRTFVADDPEDLAQKLVSNTRPQSEATLPPTSLLLGAFLGGGKVRAACAVILDHFPLGAFLGVLLGAFLGGGNALALVAWALRYPEHPVGLLVVLLLGVPLALAGAIIGAVLGVLLGIVLGANRVLNRFSRP